MSTLIHNNLVTNLDVCPECLQTDPSSGKVSKKWLHWKRMFNNFLVVLPQRPPSIFQHMEECTEHEAAVGILQALFVKPWNERLPLIKAIQEDQHQLQRPSSDEQKKKYFLMVVDEYSRFLFVFPCLDVSTNMVLKCLTSLFSLVGMPAYVHSDLGASSMSWELCKIFLSLTGVASSWTTSYNLEGNGKAERYNGMIWKGVTMSLKTKNLPLKNWQDVLPVCSLLCTVTNETPHERFFGFSRRLSTGTSIPTWLATPRLVYIKHQVCTSKMDPLIDEVELLQVNRHYAHVRYPDGR